MAFPNHIEITIPAENVEQNQDVTLRAQWLWAAVLGANDGFISVASLMMGAGVLKDEVRVAILTFLGGIFASACSLAVGELVSASSQMDVLIAQMKREGSTNLFRAALESSLAFSLGAFALAPILAAAYISQYSFVLAVMMVAAATLVLTMLCCIGAALGRSRVVSSCIRVLVGGWMAMAIAVSFTKLV